MWTTKVMFMTRIPDKHYSVRSLCSYEALILLFCIYSTSQENRSSDMCDQQSPNCASSLTALRFCSVKRRLWSGCTDGKHISNIQNPNGRFSYHAAHMMTFSRWIRSSQSHSQQKKLSTTRRHCHFGHIMFLWRLST